jgi:hypothetical protein
MALSRTLDEDTESVPNEYQEALDRLETLQEKSRLDREEGARQSELIDRQPASQNQSGGVNCREEDPGVKQAMYDAYERGRKDYTQFYCAAINTLRAVIWKTEQCLENNRNLSAAQRIRMESELTTARQTIAESMRDARRALGAQAKRPCWSQYCAD